MTQAAVSRGELLKSVLAKFAGGLIGLGILFFLPAGTLSYWQAWVWLAVLAIPAFCMLMVLLVRDPGLVQRRMQFQEKEQKQRRVIGIGWIWLFITLVLPGFDHRFGWSHVPTVVVWGSDVVMFVGYCLFVLVLRENSFASRVVEVQQGQKVISTGPYAIVRHPLYVSALVIYAFTPLALGSYWGVPPALLLIPLLVVRILDEERLLKIQLPGYEAYMQKVRWRLAPGVW